MEQTEFLEKNVFTDLKNLNQGTENEDVHLFSEADFNSLLDRVEHYGIGLYTIETWINGASQDLAGHEDFKKKATDPKWYRKAFNAFKTKNSDLQYTATYKVSSKLLAR